jgi:hypothetical protein
MDLINELAAEVRGAAQDPSIRPLVRSSLPRMADMGNVPRNEKKFKNFLTNSLRVRPRTSSSLPPPASRSKPAIHLLGLCRSGGRRTRRSCGSSSRRRGPQRRRR